MPRTQINCPNCRQPIVADIQQLFDVGEDPADKQRLLSGTFNLARCPHCGFQGNLATPIVYHDPEKELLLTFVPSEIGLPRDEQERVIGSLINRVIDRLPQEKRKGYLLQPKANLTMQSLIERILEADGITPEMIEAQQKKLNLLQRMATASSDDARANLLAQEQDLVDVEFFGLLSRLMETARLSGDQESAEGLEELQTFLLENTEIGEEIRQQTEEVQAAVNSLREVGEQLTRDKLLDIVVDAPSDTRVEILVSLARDGMDYEFFRLLTDRIDRARGTGRKRLIELRELLLELTRKYDEEMQARSQQMGELLEKLIEEENISEAVRSILPVVDEMFLRVLNQQIESARTQGDIERSSKLQQVLKVIEEASEPPPEVALIEEFLNAPDDNALHQLFVEHHKEITPELISILSNLTLQMEEANQNPELIDRLKTLTRQVRRFSMQSKLGGN
jgi:predicted outer membrane protein